MSIKVFPVKAQNFLICTITSNVFNRFTVNKVLPITVTPDKMHHSFPSNVLLENTPRDTQHRNALLNKGILYRCSEQSFHKMNTDSDRKVCPQIQVKTKK